MPKYDDLLFSPPAPVARVVLRDPASLNTLSDIPMLIDCGADVSVIPSHVLDRLGAVVDSNDGVEMVGFDGRARISPLARLDLSFAGKTFKGRFPILSQKEQDWGIIGRDIFNHVVTVLDGPGLEWSLK
ncbi:MAG: aspartyl protease family protein [Acidobacteria bacterium]|nr:aspartyl protease family protein [Acidobacteriota bacterium]